jgi:hypothetical protein
MIQDVSNRLLRDFAECLQRSIEGPHPEESAATAAPAEAPSPPLPPNPAKPVSGFSLFMGALWDRVRRLLRRGR